MCWGLSHGNVCTSSVVLFVAEVVKGGVLFWKVGMTFMSSRSGGASLQEMVYLCVKLTCSRPQRYHIQYLHTNALLCVCSCLFFALWCL